MAKTMEILKKGCKRRTGKTCEFINFVLINNHINEQPKPPLIIGFLTTDE